MDDPPPGVCSAPEKTKRTRNLAVGTVKKSTETMSCAWFFRNVRQVCDGGFRRRGMYFETAAWLISIPSFCSRHDSAPRASSASWEDYIEVAKRRRSTRSSTPPALSTKMDIDEHRSESDACHHRIPEAMAGCVDAGGRRLTAKARFSSIPRSIRTDEIEAGRQEIPRRRPSH
jgi:hypothetical protein